jgi:phage-related protein
MIARKEDGPRRTSLSFYFAPSGAQPVRDWLRSLPADQRKEVGRDLMRAQWRWPVGMPLCRPMGGGLWEVRSNLPHGRTARVLFCVEDSGLVALHGFIKKTQKTPDTDLELARKRMKEVKKL